jgi:hypothetical protein
VISRLDAGEFERAVTWNLVIAAGLFGKDVKPRDEGAERYFTDTFHICRQSGAWHDWATGSGGYSSIGLVRHLRPDYSTDDAVKHVVKFLAANPGTGQLEAEDEAWTATRQAATAALAKHYLEIAEPFYPRTAPSAPT